MHWAFLSIGFVIAYIATVVVCVMKNAKQRRANRQAFENYTRRVRRYETSIRLRRRLGNTEADRVIRQIQRLLDDWEAEREAQLSELLRHHFSEPRMRRPRRKKKGTKVDWSKEGF